MVVEIAMSSFQAFLKWLALAAITLLSQNTAFTLYKVANPQTMGFMGDESPYGFETMLVALITLIFWGLNSIPAGYWKKRKGSLIAVKVLITTFMIQAAFTSALLLSPLYYYRWFVAN